MAQVVIIGSAKLRSALQRWLRYFENRGDLVLDYPRPIAPERFQEEYPRRYRDFFRNLTQADLVFVMNEEKNGIPGYIGGESFAELTYVLVRKLNREQQAEIFLCRQPGEANSCYEEVRFWLDRGILRIWEDCL